MRFEKIIIENFASFFGKHVIEFNSSKEKPITVIIGGSGKGKTSIFDALNWALYGTQYEPVLVKESQKALIDFANETAFTEAIKNNTSFEMSCSLYFEHEEKRYRIQQEICFMQVNGRRQITDQACSLIQFQSNGNVVEIYHIESFLNEILPNNVRDYFLFNGDRINRLALPGSSQEIKDGIYRVVDLELLQNGVAHLTEIAKKFRKQAKDSSYGEMAEIESQYTTTFEELEKSKEKLRTLQNEKRALDDNFEVYSEKLRGMDTVKQFQSRRDVLKVQIENCSAALKQTIIDLRSSVVSSLPITSIPDIDFLTKLLSEKKQKGEIPSAISETLINEILEIGKCLCGTEFEVGSDVYNRLKMKLQGEKEKQKVGEDLLDLYYDLGTAKNEILKQYKRIDDLDQRRSNLDKSIINFDKEYREILKKLENAPEEEISKLALKIKEIANELTTVSLDIQKNQTRISEKEEQVRRIQNKREELGLKQEKVRKLQLRDDLAQQSADELNKIFEKFAEDSRIEVQEMTEKVFKDFIPTASRLKVGIDQEFHYDIRDQNGIQALQQLSQGQKQALSLAYITSISRVSEKDPPLVIDYPLGRLDIDVQDNIAKILPDLASQVILMVLPGTEWNENTEAILRPRCSDIYELEFNNETRQSSLVKKR